MVDRVSRGGGCVKGTYREGPPAGVPVGYVEKGFGEGISFHRGSVRGAGNLEEGSSAGDFERW